MHDLTTAYKTALAEVCEDGLVCVCGSLYLAGTFKKMLLGL
jgi:folylpolyglutamate synthase/dihydropteroate synthase